MATLLVSDLHLDAAQPQTVEQFVALLRGDARRAEALYILGDLFETWLGDDLLDAVRNRVCAELRKLTAAGVPLFVMRGNRDFLFDEGFSRLTGATLLPDPTILELAGRRTLLTHGDLLCTDDASYQQLRSLTQDPAFRARLRRLGLRTRTRLAALARAGSRRHMAQARPSIMDVNVQAVERVMARTNVERVIHGHTHRPGSHMHMVDGRRCERLVLDAWYEGGQCLRVDRDGAVAQRLPPLTPADRSGNGTADRDS